MTDETTKDLAGKLLAVSVLFAKFETELERVMGRESQPVSDLLSRAAMVVGSELAKGKS